MVSETTYEQVNDSINARFVASAKVKGREQEVKFYEILSVKEEVEK